MLGSMLTKEEVDELMREADMVMISHDVSNLYSYP